MLHTVVITTSEVIMERSDKNVYSQVDKIHFHSLSQNIQKVGSDERRQYSQAYSPKDATFIVMNKQHARIAHDGHYISLQTLWSVQQELSVMVPRPVSRPVSPHPPFMESLFTGCWSHKLLNVLCERLPYEVQHWRVCLLLNDSLDKCWWLSAEHSSSADLPNKDKKYDLLQPRRSTRGWNSIKKGHSSLSNIVRIGSKL